MSEFENVSKWDISFSEDIIKLTQYDSFTNRMIENQIKLKEEAVKEALIKLGWTPPLSQQWTDEKIRPKRDQRCLVKSESKGVVTATYYGSIGWQEIVTYGEAPNILKLKFIYEDVIGWMPLP